MLSDNGLSGGDSDDGVNVAELRMDDVDDESSSSRKADIRGLFAVGGRISSSSLSESMVMQSTDTSADLLKKKRRTSFNCFFLKTTKKTDSKTNMPKYLGQAKVNGSNDGSHQMFR